MKAEYEHIVPTLEEFEVLLHIVHSNSLYAVQTSWEKKDVVPAVRLRDPSAPRTRGVMFTQHDRVEYGFACEYPLVKAVLGISPYQLIAELDKTDALPDVAVWFAELCERYGAACENSLMEKAQYRLFNTPEVAASFPTLYEQRIVVPFMGFKPLRVRFAGDVVMGYFRATRDEMIDFAAERGFAIQELSALGAVTIDGGRVYEYDTSGEPLNHKKVDERLADTVRSYHRLRKLNALLAE